MKQTALFLLLILTALGIRAQTPLTTAVDFTVTDTHGQQHSLFNYLDSGKYVVLDFFYVSCLACQATAPAANASYEHFGCNQGGVVFLGIDFGDSNSQVQYFDTFFGVNYPCASGTQGGGDSVNTTYGIVSYPCYILIAPDRNIVIQEINPFTETDCNNAIAGYGVAPMTCNTGIDADRTMPEPFHLRTFPNPASEMLSVAFTASPDNHYELEIIDLAGRVTGQACTMITSGNAHIGRLDVSAIVTGIYSVRLVENGRYVTNERFSIIR